MKQKRSPIVQVAVPAKEYQALQELANRGHTSVSALARKLLLDAPEYQKLKEGVEETLKALKKAGLS